MKVEVSATTLFPLTQCTVEVAEKLQNSFFSSAVTSSRVLYREWMNGSIMTSDFESAMANTNAPN
jgi:hypothetical protein